MPKSLINKEKVKNVKTKSINYLNKKFENVLEAMTEEERHKNISEYIINNMNPENNLKLATGRLIYKNRMSNPEIPSGEGTSNQFKILENNNDGEDPERIDSEDELQDPDDDNSATPRTGIENGNKKNNRKSYIPPIVVYNVDIKKTINDLGLFLKHKNFNLKSLNKNCIHIITNSIEDFDLASQFVKNNQYNHYTYTPAERKSINLLIKGISNTFTTDEIINEINDKRLDNVEILKCTPFRTRRTSPSSNIFLLSLSNNSDTKELIKIKYILHQKVYFENIRKQEGIGMCHRCQKIGHSAANCFMNPRCVKCSGEHLTVNCDSLKTIIEKKVDPRTGEIITKSVTIPKCVNCGQEGHPANYTKCEARIAYINNIKEKRERNRIMTIKQNNFIQKSINNYVQPNKSYAQQLYSDQQNYRENPQNSSNFDYFEKECQNKLGDNLFNIIEKVNSFVSYYKDMPEHNKKRALITFIMSLC